MSALALRRTTQAPNGRALAYPQQYSRRTATACRNRRAPPSSARFHLADGQSHPIRGADGTDRLPQLIDASARDSLLCAAVPHSLRLSHRAQTITKKHSFTLVLGGRSTLLRGDRPLLVEATCGDCHNMAPLPLRKRRGVRNPTRSYTQPRAAAAVQQRLDTTPATCLTIRRARVCFRSHPALRLY
jgi:hypothetical protein